ncbi:MAG: succinylglutamate desuccinylase/aspartoacylase family protein [Desulfobacterales bacterium]|jgi:succinylglutamate desuccinylase
MQNEESREVYLTYFQKQSNCELPYCIEVASNREGAHVMVVGGTHGNEPAGVKAMVDFHQQLQNGEIQLEGGKVSLLLGNPQGYQKDQRYIQWDLNRCFDTPDNTTIEGRRAIDIIQYLERNNDTAALLDLHSVSIGDFKICVYEKNSPDSLKLTLSISDIPLHFAYHPAHMPGTLIGVAGQHHICGLIVECGNHLSEKGIKTAQDHMQAMLAHYQILPASAEAPKKDGATIKQYESICAIKPGPNFRFLIADVATGTKLSKGQLFAKDDHGEHIAPQECYIVVPSRVVKATDVDAGFLGRLNQLKMDH